MPLAGSRGFYGLRRVRGTIRAEQWPREVQRVQPPPARRLAGRRAIAGTAAPLCLAVLLLPTVCAGSNADALLRAAREGDTQTAAKLLGKRVDPNAPDDKGLTPLLLASARGHAGIVELLVDKGAEVNAPGPQQITPLHLAAAGGHAEVVKLLLERGADSAAVIEPLVRSGADPAAEDWFGGNALCTAADGVALEAAGVLLQLGVDVNAKSKEGKTALDYARARGSQEMIDLLTRAGAK